MQQEVDKDLQSLFEGKSRSLPEEPFLGNILRLIEKQRFRRDVLLRKRLCDARARHLSPKRVQSAPQCGPSP